MSALEMLEKSFSKAGPRSKCEGCPFAGMCSPCKPQTIDFRQANVRVVGGANEILSEKPQRLGVNTLYILDSAGQRGSEPPTQKRTEEKICSICKEAASICGHSEFKAAA